MTKNKDKRKLGKKITDWLEEHFSSIPYVKKFMFIHHLEIMSKAGLSIVNSLEVLIGEMDNPKLKKIIIQIKKEVEEGKQLHEVLKNYPKIFPPIYVSMIAAGEISGKLDEALGQISIQMKKNQRLTSKIRSAMIYPVVIITAMIGISFFVVFYIMPKLLVMFEEMNAELPLITKVLMQITYFMQNYWWLVIILIVLIIALFGQAIKNYNFKKIIHKLILNFPIFGQIIKKINLARFTMSLSSLLSSTIPIIDAVKISSDVLGNIIYKESLLTATDSLKKGENLSKILAQYPKNFPSMVTEMIMVGEQTGKIEKMLQELSDYYNDEVDETMNNFTAIIEPLVILLLGIGVAGIVVAVMLPMYSLAQSV